MERERERGVIEIEGGDYGRMYKCIDTEGERGDPTSAVNYTAFHSIGVQLGVVVLVTATWRWLRRLEGSKVEIVVPCRCGTQCSPVN